MIAQFRRGCQRGAAEQLQHPSLHGAARPDERSTKARAICCFARRRRCFAPSCLLSRRCDQPHVFVLLSGHSSAGQAALSDRLQHQRQLRRLGGLSEEEYEASKQDLIETTLDALEQVRSQLSPANRPCRSGDAEDVRALHQAPRAAPALAPSSKGWPSAAPCRSKSAVCTTPGSRGIIMSRLAGSDQLRRDRGQRRR